MSVSEEGVKKFIQKTLCKFILVNKCKNYNNKIKKVKKIFVFKNNEIMKI